MQLSHGCVADYTKVFLDDVKVEVDTLTEDTTFSFSSLHVLLTSGIIYFLSTFFLVFSSHTFKSNPFLLWFIFFYTISFFFLFYIFVSFISGHSSGFWMVTWEKPTWHYSLFLSKLVLLTSQSTESILNKVNKLFNLLDKFFNLLTYTERYVPILFYAR